MKDKHALLEMPGAGTTAGTGKKQVTQSREAFRVSVGQMNGPGGGAGRTDGTGGSGDPTIAYPVGVGRPRVLPRTGKFSTAYHVGRKPVNYDENLSSYMLEY